jgi:hypothetical protein
MAVAEGAPQRGSSWDWLSGAGLYTLLAAYLAGLAVAELCPLLAAAAHLYLGRALATAIFALAFLVAGVVGHAQRKRLSAGPESTPPSPLPRWTWLFFAYGLVVYALLWLLAHALPDLSYDGNTYHLASIGMWSLAGRIHWIQEPLGDACWMNGHPKAGEVLAFLLTRATGDGHWVTALNLMFLPLGAVGIALLSRRLGASRGLAPAAGVAFLLLPVNLAQSSTTYVDSAFACCAAAALALALYLWSERHREGGVGLGEIAQLGIAVGLAAGIKQSGLVLALPIFALTAGTLWAGRPGPASPRLVRAAGLLLALLAVAAVCGGYWYGRNWVMTGSPLYPGGLQVAGRTIFPGPRASALIGGAERDEVAEGRLPRFLPVRLAYVWAQGLSAYPRSELDYDSEQGGLGLLWPLACLPALVVLCARALRRRSPPPRDLVLALTALVVLAFLGTPMNWWARFTVWIYALGLPCFAVLWTELAARPGRSWGRFWAGACLVLLVLESAYCVAHLVESDKQTPLSFRSSPGALFRRSSWQWPAQGFPLFPPETAAFPQILPPTVPVAVGPGVNGRMVGQLCVPLGVRPIMALTEDCSPAALQQARARGFRYLLWGNTAPPPPAVAAVTQVVAQTRDMTLLEIK